MLDFSPYLAIPVLVRHVAVLFITVYGSIWCTLRIVQQCTLSLVFRASVYPLKSADVPVGLRVP